MRLEHAGAWIVPAAVIAASAAPAQTIHTVELEGILFAPADIAIDVGDTVRWVWVSGFHDVESGDSGTPTGDGKFTAGEPVFPPMTFEFVFGQAFLDANPVPGGVYPYYCSVHFGLGMTGTVTVQSASACIDDLDCDDADACNGVETCRTGECVEGAPPDCNDGNTCTDDSCDVNLGCRNTDNNVPCDDGDACTTNDTCSGGMCVGGAGISCDDGDFCTDDACVNGACTHTENAASCDDGDSCTESDVCVRGVCGGVPITGCCSTDADCDDDDACSIDTCAEGVCVNTPAQGCTSCEDDTDCDDGNACTDDTCESGVCETHANEVLCDDGDPCTVEDVCGVGTCVGIPLDGCCRNADECDDRDPCTTESCVDNECAYAIVAGCGGENDEDPSTPEHPDTADAGEDDQDTGAPLPSDEGMDSPRAPPRGPCGLVGMAVLLATLLGLGFLRVARPWDAHKYGRAEGGR